MQSQQQEQSLSKETIQQFLKGKKCSIPSNQIYSSLSFLQQYDYRVIQLIDTGSYGVVMKALDGSNGNRVVAVKLIIVADSDILKDKIQEYQKCLLIKHPNVVKNYQQLFDEENECYFIISEFCELGNLYNYFQENSLTYQEILQICTQMIEGIISFHEQNIIHSDLKPQNILLASNCQIKICDLGISKQLTGGSKSHTIAKGGSLDFMAPEQVEGKLSKQCDVYAIGCIICFLCKVNVFGLNMVSVKQGIFPSIELNNFKELASLAFKLMEINPKQRMNLKDCLNQVKQLKIDIFTDSNQVLQYKNGDIYQGQLKDGKRNGKGVLFFSKQDKSQRKKYDGEWVNDQFEGFGILEWKSGQKYEGQLKNNKLKGKGVLYYKNGDKYEGDFENDKFNGKGTIQYNEQDQWKRKKYEGDFVNDNREGFCIFEWKDGLKYEGYFKNNHQNGKGVSYYSNGDKYEGNFKDGKLNGKGTIYYSEQDQWNRKKYEGGFVNHNREGFCIFEWKDGMIYEGKMKNNKFKGKGILYYANGDKYEGNFEDSKLNGKGVFYYANGDKYEGNFKDNKLNGKGTIQYSEQDQYNRKKYEGDFVDNNAEGFCIFEWKDGKKYEGYFKNNSKNGKGVLYHANGDQYKGNFENDKYNGKGVYYFANGDNYEGYFKNDKFNGKGIFYYKNGKRQEGEYLDGIRQN